MTGKWKNNGEEFAFGLKRGKLGLMKNYFKNLAKFFYVSFIYGVILVSGMIVAAILMTAGLLWLAWPYFLLHYSPWFGLLFILSFGSFFYITEKLEDC